MIRSRVEALLLACAVSCASGACQPGSSVPKGANSERSPVAAPRASVSITAAPSSAPRTRGPVRASCGLRMPEPVELLPVIHGKVVVRRNLAAVKLLGHPRLIHEPEDFAEYYLAESDVALASLPVSLKSLRGASLDREPGLAVQNAAYERLVAARGLALPKRWWDLPRA